MSLADSSPGDRCPLIGNLLCVDFANTVFPAGAGGSLQSWSGLVDFLEAAGILRKAHRAQVVSLAATAPEATAEVFSTALELRAAIRKALEAIATGQAMLPEWVGAVNAVLRWTEGYDQLVPAGAGWRVGFVERQERLEWLLAAVARSAAELIAEGSGAAVRKCANPACVLYFYDVSRTGRRRWCSMAVCGNRNKVAAYARRRRPRAVGRADK